MTGSAVNVVSGLPKSKEPTVPVIEKFLFNRKEAALSLGISVRSLDYLISRRELETRRIGKKVLVPRESLRKFARANHTEGIKPAANCTAA